MQLAQAAPSIKSLSVVIPREAKSARGFLNIVEISGMIDMV